MKFEPEKPAIPRWPLLAAAVWMLSTATWIAASPTPWGIDAHRAGNGSDSPFSLRLDDRGDQPEMFEHGAVTPPAVWLDWRFTEAGLNNQVLEPLGQIMPWGQAAGQWGQDNDQTRWVIWDMLAWVPAANVLFIDKGQRLSNPDEPPPPDQLLVRIGSEFPLLGDTPPNQQIPEPSSWWLLVVLAALFPARWYGRRNANADDATAQRSS